VLDRPDLTLDRSRVVVAFETGADAFDRFIAQRKSRTCSGRLRSSANPGEHLACPGNRCLTQAQGHRRSRIRSL